MVDGIEELIKLKCQKAHIEGLNEALAFVEDFCEHTVDVIARATTCCIVDDLKEYIFNIATGREE